MNFTKTQNADKSYSFTFTGIPVASGANLTFSISSLQGPSKQGEIVNPIQVILRDSAKQLCLQSTKELKVVYTSLSLAGYVVFSSTERGQNTTVMIKLTVPSSIVNKTGLVVDLYWPSEISQFLKQTFPNNFSQQVVFQQSLSTGLHQNQAFQYSPISDGSGNLHYILGSDNGIQSILAQTEISIVFSIYLPFDVNDTIGNIYGFIKYQSSPIAQYSLKTPILPPLSLRKAGIKGYFINNELHLSLEANQTFPSRFSLVLSTSNTSMIAFKDIRSRTACLDVNKVSNPSAPCNQKLTYLNGSSTQDDPTMTTVGFTSSQITLSDPLLSIAVAPGQVRRSFTVTVHNLVVKNAYMTSVIPLNLTFVASGGSAETSGVDQQLTVYVESPCPRTCTSCSSAKPSVCFDCMAGLVVQEQSCWLTLKRYNAYLSLRIIINSMISILLCLVGLHCYLSIRARPQESRFGLVYFTDAKMATSLFVYCQSFGVVCYSFVAGNYLMVTAALITCLSQVASNIAVYLWLKRTHHCKQVLFRH